MSIDRTIQQAQGAINTMLSELSISKIYYIDDKCSVNELKEIFIGSLLALHAKKPRKELFENWELPRSVFEKKIKELWEGADEDGKRELYIELLKFEGNEEDLNNSLAPLRLKKYLKDKIELFSPNEWVDNKDNILTSISNESKALCLFDIDFSGAPLGDGRNGIDLTQELLVNEDVNDNIFCGLFSHLFNVEEENERRNQYCREYNLDKNKFYTISKKRFSDDSYLPGLAEGIKNTLLIDEVESLKKISIDALKKAFKDTINEIENLNPDSFNHIIQKSSKKEGVWEIFTLIRISNILTSRKALLSFIRPTKRTEINQRLGQIRKIEKIKSGASTPTDSSQTNEIRQKEIYLESNILNTLHFPIRNGDIFKIGGKEYILLGQPCNLMVRNNGYRGSKTRNYDTGFLLPVDLIEEEVYKRYSKGQLDSIYLLQDKNIEGSKCKIIRFSTFKTISLYPLDLAVFNSKGISCIDLNKSKSDSTAIQESWENKYKILHKIFSKYKKGIQSFKRLRSANKDELKEAILYGQLFKGYDIDNARVLNNRTQTLTFDITRISNLQPPFSTDLLQNFMSYLSRNANSGVADPPISESLTHVDNLRFQ